jgi:hypothetical protein
MDGMSWSVRDLGGVHNLPGILRQAGISMDCIYEVQQNVGKLALRRIADSLEAPMMEHELRYAAWHIMEPEHALPALADWLGKVARAVLADCEIANDSSYNDSARRQAEVYADRKRQELASACQVWGWSVDWPGIYPCLERPGQPMLTVCAATAADTARTILAIAPACMVGV